MSDLSALSTGYQHILVQLAHLQHRQQDIEAEMNDPDANLPTVKLTGLAKEHGRLQRMLAPYLEYTQLQKQVADLKDMVASTDPEMAAMATTELAELGPKLDAKIEQIVDAFLAADELGVDALILEIRAGTGGDEAALFARDLAEMYRRYADRRGWTYEVMDFSPSDLGGFREIIINISGPGAWATLDMEAGGHRVQRVPATEASGRIHTSAATVAVMPEADESIISINPSEVREDVSRAGGPGGQNVNKVESAVQLTHLPTGITVRIRDERSQHKNRDKAWRILRARVFEHFDAQRRAHRVAQRKQMMGSGDRNERIRTYSFPQSRCTDHRLNENFPLEKILSGDMDDLLTAIQKRIRHDRLANLTIA
ncbi:MAG: peptide chain release factor 1 [Phycisphaerae bacterium]